jgi:hypothetical protein
MGIHGFGTLGCYKVLARPELLSELLQHVDLPLKGKGFQILVEHDISNGKINLKPKTLHLF